MKLKTKNVCVSLLAALVLFSLPLFAQGDNSTSTPVDPCCTLQQAQANVLAAATMQANFRNADLVTIYNGALANWILNVRSHGSTIGVVPLPPAPPKSFVVVTDDGWATVAPTGPPVIDPPPALPSDVQAILHPAPPPPPMNIDIGAAVFVGSTDAPAYSDVWFSVGPNDTYPSGKQTPPMQGPPDNNVHVYLKVGAAVGKGWYERVN